MLQYLKEDAFFRTLFDVIPVMALLVNEEGRIQAINKLGKNLLDLSEQEFYLKPGGEVLRCIHVQDDPQGCGFGPYCQVCIIRKTALKAIGGTMTQREKGSFDIVKGEDFSRINILVSAAPLTYKHINYALVIIEDISLITELQGLIPICAHCKKIRDDKGYWNRVEKFIESHSEAEFTHDICPECAENLLNISLAGKEYA